MSLKQSRFHKEPAFCFRGDTVEPYFGLPEEYPERIVEWVKDCPQPQTYGCYTLFKVLHQQRRIDVLEIMAETTMDAVTDRITEFRVDNDAQTQELLERLETQDAHRQELLERLETQEAQTQGLLARLRSQEAQVQGLLGLIKTQERTIEHLRDKTTRQEKSIESIQQQMSTQVTATVVTECAICGKFCDGCLPRRPFLSRIN